MYHVQRHHDKMARKTSTEHHKTRRTPKHNRHSQPTINLILLRNFLILFLIDDFSNEINVELPLCKVLSKYKFM